MQELTTHPDGIKTVHALQWAGTLPGKPANAKYYSYTDVITPAGTTTYAYSILTATVLPGYVPQAAFRRFHFLPFQILFGKTFPKPQFELQRNR